MKSIYEMNVDELKKRQKLQNYFTYICVIMGTFYIVANMYLHFRTGYIFLPLVGVFTGISLLFLAIMPYDTALLIWFKENKQ